MEVGDTMAEKASKELARGTPVWRGIRRISLSLAFVLVAAVSPSFAQQDGSALPLPPTPEQPAETAGPSVGRLGDALEQMNEQNPVVARVNGYDIRWAAVTASADDLPPRYRDQLESVFPALLDRLVDIRLLADSAREQGLLDDTEVQERMVRLEDRVLSNVLLERHLAEQVTTAAVRKQYDAMVNLRRSNLEVRARHILVESEEEAVAIIAQLDEGAIFPSLARDYSIGPSGERGGDLGYFFSRRMDPDFAAALNALEPGSYTTSPVETEFGWHIILLVDRRDDDIPSFIDMQDQLREELKKEAIAQLVGSLRQRALLEMFPEDAVAVEQEKPETISDR